MCMSSIVPYKSCCVRLCTHVCLIYVLETIPLTLMVASPSSSTWTKSYSPRQQPVPSGGSLYFLSGFLSHLLTLSLLRHNLLSWMLDVMLDHNHVISACNITTMSALFSRSYKD